MQFPQDTNLNKAICLKIKVATNLVNQVNR